VSLPETKRRRTALQRYDLRTIDWSGGFDAVAARLGVSMNTVWQFAHLYALGHSRAWVGLPGGIYWDRVDWRLNNGDLSYLLNIGIHSIRQQRVRNDVANTVQQARQLPVMREPVFYGWLHGATLPACPSPYRERHRPGTVCPPPPTPAGVAQPRGLFRRLWAALFPPHTSR
jgi:hypothetical protein